MQSNIFTSTKNWTFSKADSQAEEKLKVLTEQERKALPEGFFHLKTLTHIDHIKKSPLFLLMHSIPKGTLHHLHHFCSDDEQFYRLYVINDKRIYLTPDLCQYEIGTAAQAKQKGWVSMQEGIQKHGYEKWLQTLVSLGCFTNEEFSTMNYKQSDTWDVFERKIITPVKLFVVRDLFRKYTKHMFLKYIRNGYQRVEVRHTLQPLFEYDEEGNFIAQHPVSVMRQEFDQVCKEVTELHPQFSFGFVYAGFKMWDDETSYQNMKEVCGSGWDKLVGFDFVQEEDKFPGIEKYDKVINRVLEEFPQHSHLKKVYHAGETVCHRTNNVDLAVKAGTVRIGHGLNILQRTEFLPHCKNVCFEKNPLSNMILGYKDDLRQASAPVLLGLGYPVSLSPDDPGKFGLQDTTGDYFIAVLAYNWSLKHLKLIALHSINYAVCEQGQRTSMLRSFNSAWNAWVSSFLEGKAKPIGELEKKDLPHEYSVQDIFSKASGWSFSQEQEKKVVSFEEIRQSVINKLPADIYSNRVFEYKRLMKESQLFDLIAKIPKGVLSGCNLFSFVNQSFIAKLIELDQDISINLKQGNLIYGSAESKIDSKDWEPLTHLRQNDEAHQVVSSLLSLVTLKREEIELTSGNHQAFWKQFNSKWNNITTLLTHSDKVFDCYLRHTFRSIASLGYLRAQFRAPFYLLKSQQQIENATNLIHKAASDTHQDFPGFSVGIIILADKNQSDASNLDLLNICAKLNSPLVVGVDFWQQVEDQAPHELTHYDNIVNQILQQHQHLRWGKFYQAGNSSSHKNTNILQAMQAGSKRVSNANCILQQVHLLPHFRDICFEVSPLLTLAEGASKKADLRMSSASILVGLGLPVTIGAELSGVIGFGQPTYELFAAAIAFNWSLKHFKLIALHSVNHAAVTAGKRSQLRQQLQQQWRSWAQ